jgi:ferredoxin
MSYEIKQDKDACIGCGGCVAICSQNWKMDGPKAAPISTSIEELGCNQQAVEVCPVKCIEIVKK